MANHVFVRLLIVVKMALFLAGGVTSKKGPCTYLLPFGMDCGCERA